MNKPRAIPRILVRIDRGEDWVEMCGDLDDNYPAMCGEGDCKDWLDYAALTAAYDKLSDAVME